MIQQVVDKAEQACRAHWGYSFYKKMIKH